jgi:hypothetical protein
MIKLHPKSRLNINISHLGDLKLPEIKIYAPYKNDEPEVKKIIYIEKKPNNNKNEELF